MEPNSKSGLDKDFLNEISALYLAFESFELGNFSAEKAYKLITDTIHKSKGGVLINTYEARYPDNKFEGVITEANRENVEKLNELVKNCNALFRTIIEDKLGSFENKMEAIKIQIMPIANEIERLVRGEEIN